MIALMSTGSVFADPPATTMPSSVSISATGTDVKLVLGQLFGQVHKNFVIEPNTYFALNLSLDKVDFDEALMIVLKIANLKSELQNGIYYISKAPAKKPTVDNSATTTPTTTVPAKPVGTLPKTVLTKKLTTRLAKIDIRELFTEITKQTGVTIEIDKSVPNYKLDAYLINTSLKYALDQITTAAGLEYKFTDTLSIQIIKPAEETSRVSIVTGG
jgi:hypothetical protein